MTDDRRMVSEALYGEQRAASVLQCIEGNPDALYREVVDAVDQGDAARARLRALCRTVQKALERSRSR